MKQTKQHTKQQTKDLSLMENVDLLQLDTAFLIGKLADLATDVDRNGLDVSFAIGKLNGIEKDIDKISLNQSFIIGLLGKYEKIMQKTLNKVDTVVNQFSNLQKAEAF